MDRYFLDAPLEGEVVLRDEEFHHLARVMRTQVGDEVALFDGCGGAARATVVAIGKRDARLRIDSVAPGEATPGPEIVIATATPKGDRAKWMIEKLTELGVDSWTPLQTGRSVADPGTGKLERLQQTVIAACKQCGRIRLLRLEQPAPWSEWLQREIAHGPILVADRDGIPINEALERFTESRLSPERWCAAVGPEGGFTTDELRTARALGAWPVCLSQTILRIETAAVALAAVLQTRRPAQGRVSDD